WQPKGKRRIHRSPEAAEIAACRPRLDAELARIRPEIVVCLGATAAHALLGRDFKVSLDRGRLGDSPVGPALATVHPSPIQRAPYDKAGPEPRGAGAASGRVPEAERKLVQDVDRHHRGAPAVHRDDDVASGLSGPREVAGLKVAPEGHQAEVLVAEARELRIAVRQPGGAHLAHA